MIYALGVTSDGRTACPAIEVYDPATNTWSSKATMPEPCSRLCTVTIGGRICTLGGFSGSWSEFADDSAVVLTKSVALYDPASDACSPKPDMAVHRAYFATTSVDGRICVFGGVASVRKATTRVVEALDTGVREEKAVAATECPLQDRIHSVLESGRRPSPRAP